MMELAAIDWLAVHEVANWCVRIAMIPVVLARRRSTDAATAWLLVIFFYPLGGVIVYLMFGTTRMATRRSVLQRAMLDARRLVSRLAAHEVSDGALARQAEKISGLPVVRGNQFEFLADWRAVIDRLIADIDSAGDHVHLLFYIFSPDQTGRRVVDALIRAASRGVKCRVLVDQMASRRIFRLGNLAHEMRHAGVEVFAAMRVSGLRRFVSRFDLRNHRKFAVIDAKLAWIGSQNITNADYGGRRGGPWFDIMARVNGPVVAELQTVFLEDWLCETGEELQAESVLNVPGETGNTSAQVVATGPAESVETYNRIVITAAGVARQELILTTPYFAPDESTLLALLMAADRGVKVTLIVPEMGDQIFAAACGRAFCALLIQGGCEVQLFQPGLIHAKSITIDGQQGTFGSANLDVRSFKLNFELNMLIYDPAAVMSLRAIQLGYLSQSRPLTLAQHLARPAFRRLIDRICALLAPLL